MPHIRIRALQPDQVASLSKTLVKDLATTIKTDEDNFTFELVTTQFFQQGQTVKGTPFVEVFWFPRTSEVQQQAAELITTAIKKLVNEEYITVVFLSLLPENYYENGQHF